MTVLREDIVRVLDKAEQNGELKGVTALKILKLRPQDEFSDYKGKLLSERQLLEDRMRSQKFETPVNQYRYLEGVLAGLNRAVNLMR